MTGSTAPRRRVLVTGATGYMGGRLVPRLLEHGFSVRCLVRDPSRLEGRNWEGIEVCRGDVLQPDTLPSALEGIEAAYYLVHSMAAGEKGFEERDRRAAANFARAAKAAGVQRIIYLGGLGSDAGKLSAHLRSRHETGDVLRAEGPPVTEFRASVIVGSGSMSFEMMRYLTERIPVMICPRWVTTRTQPIGVGDVLRYLVDCLDEPRSVGRTLEIGGRDVLTYEEMMKSYARIRGLPRWIIRVPVLTPRLSSYWVDLVTPIPASYARPLIEGLGSEVVVHDPSARELFPFEPMSFEEAVREALDRYKRDEVETVWSMSLTSSRRDGTAPVALEAHEGMLVEQRRLRVELPAERVYRTFLGIGGKRGWLAWDWAWELRGWLDRLVGGVGMRRGRRHPDLLLPGEPLDFWRVEEVIPNRRLRLRAEMKVPGRAWLQFEVEDRPEGGCDLIQTAFFEPKGLGGHLYWYALYPIHAVIFSQMIRAIAHRARTTPPASLVPPLREDVELSNGVRRQ